jgi:hypothetical protein
MERGRRLPRYLVPLIAVAFAWPSSAAAATGAGANVTYRGTHVAPVSAAAVDLRQLARFDAQRLGPSGPLTPFLLPEPQEKAEPNVAITLPSPFGPLPGADPQRAALPSPAPSASFVAHLDAPRAGTSTSVIPPDTNGAVGLTKLMVSLNNNYVIEDKATGAVLSTVSTPTFWAASGARDPFDPKTLYDPYNNRWLVSAVSDPGTSTSSILLGISDTPDPSGGWHLYRFDADSGNALWADFPAFGFNKNLVAVHVNMFSNANNAFSQGRLLVVGYPSLRNHSPSAGYTVGLPSFTTQPAVTYSPTESTLFGVEHLGSASGTYRFWAVTGLTAVTLVGGAPKTNPLGPWTIPGSANILPQIGGDEIDSGDARVSNAVFRNGGIYYAQTIGLPAGGTPGYPTRTAVQWVELDRNGRFVQGGRVADPAATETNGGHWYAYPAISVNDANDVLVGFSEFESDDFADAGYALHAGSDSAGTMREPVTLKQGEGIYWKTFNGTRNRWGDYSSVQVDPSNDHDLWTIQEFADDPYASGDGSGRWGTWWGKVIGAGAPAPPPPLKPCVVPNVLGQRLRPAAAKLRSRNCRVGTVRYVRSTRAKKGRVVRERPGVGRRLENQAKVNLWLGRGPRR